MSGNRLNTPKGEMSGNGSGPAIAHLPPGSIRYASCMISLSSSLYWLPCLLPEFELGALLTSVVFLENLPSRISFSHLLA
jgi:hypothetical protein